MGVGKLRKAAAWGILLLFSLMLAACSDVSLTPVAGRQTFPVETVFKEFYQILGGQQVLGPAISALEIRNNLQCQFTESALLCFDPTATNENRFNLFPLGKSLGIQEDTLLVGAVSTLGGRVVDGIPIYEDFIPLYDKLYGARYVGRPLTQMRINNEYDRAEQFFENVGFYQNLKDPSRKVYLIPYGAYLCGGACSYRLDEYWSIVNSSAADQPFAPSLARLGGPAVFGAPLVKSHMAEDGSLQQVYTNAIFFAPQDNLSSVRLRPLPLMLGYPVYPPVPMVSHDQLVFYEMENGLGYNVPKPFDYFIAMHGGRELSGRPISEVLTVAGKSFVQQCFENYCLLYDPAAPEALKVRLAPLGEEYLQRFPQPEEMKIRNLFSNVSLVASADFPTLNDNDAQYVRMVVQNGETGGPLELVEADLILNVPNQPAVRMTLPPTDANGVSGIAIPAQPGIANGTRISFQVCLNLPLEEPVCVMDSYLIWNVP